MCRRTAGQSSVCRFVLTSMLCSKTYRLPIYAGHKIQKVPGRSINLPGTNKLLSAVPPVLPEVSAYHPACTFCTICKSSSHLPASHSSCNGLTRALLKPLHRRSHDLFLQGYSHLMYPSLMHSQTVFLYQRNLIICCRAENHTASPDDLPQTRQLPQL